MSPPQPRRLPSLALLAATALAACQPGVVRVTGPATGATAATTTTLAVSATGVTEGGSVTLTATVSPPAATGAVTFRDGAASLGSADVSEGKAVLLTSSLAVGVHAIAARYGGSAAHAASGSEPVTVTVTSPGDARVATTTTLSASATSVTAGARVTLTATVSPSAARGTVTFRDGAASLGSADVGAGQAVLSTSSLAAGAHAISASYAGSTSHAASGSEPVTVTVTSSAGPDCSRVGNFSFFVTSWAALQRLSGSPRGFGGNLRYPDRNDPSPGAGLQGADRICAAIADSVEDGSSRCKTWRAFLSVAKDENGARVNAIDRIGAGPWYDRNGRVFAQGLSDLNTGRYNRPRSCAAAICMDFPNETGTLNHNPDGTGNVDNHDMLTGSDWYGKLHERGAKATCADWTMNTYDPEYQPRCGHPWPTWSNDSATIDPDRLRSQDDLTMSHWISAFSEGGCVPGSNLNEDINFPQGEMGTWVGGSGGYGGWYCFAILTR